MRAIRIKVNDETPLTIGTDGSEVLMVNLHYPTPPGEILFFAAAAGLTDGRWRTGVCNVPKLQTGDTVTVQVFAEAPADPGQWSEGDPGSSVGRRIRFHLPHAAAISLSAGALALYLVGDGKLPGSLATIAGTMGALVLFCALLPFGERLRHRRRRLGSE